MKDEAGNDGIDLIHMLSVMYRNWKFMTIVVLVSILTIGLLSVTQKRMYGSWVIFFPVPMREYLNKDNLRDKKQAIDNRKPGVIPFKKQDNGRENHSRFWPSNKMGIQRYGNRPTFITLQNKD